MRIGIPLASAAAALVLVAAGCGGGEPSAEEEWAQSVCTSVAGWKTELEQIANNVTQQLQSPATASADAVRDGIENGVEATEDLVGELKALGPPDTESGAQAKQELTDLADELEKTVDQAKAAVGQLPDDANLSDVVGAITGIVGGLQALAQEAQSTLDSIEQVSGDFKEGFENADACQDLRADQD